MASRIETRQVGDRSMSVVVLECGPATAEIWPELGGNCVRWHHAEAGELLFAPPIEELIDRPTRGGIPILFPFPNRIRDGHFNWAGRDYYLPKNDSTQQNAIHGFAARQKWKATNIHSDGVNAVATLRHHGTDFTPDNQLCWPADWILDIHWLLYESRIDISIVVTNSDNPPLPLGFGLHPYFKTSSGNDYIKVPAAARWELQDTLPTGKINGVPSQFDLRSPKRVSSLQLDDIYTQIESVIDADGLRPLGTFDRSDGWKIDVQGSEQFHDVVVFTPPHRQALCIEPYSCPTDAINLFKTVPDCGWQILAPKQKWMAGVRILLSHSA